MSESDLFSNKKCPPGSLAHHHRYGLVEVISSIGLFREIYCQTFDDNFQPYTIMEVVHVTALREMNIARSFGLEPQSVAKLYAFKNAII